MAEISVKIPDELKKQIEESHIDVSPLVIESITNELTRVLTLRAIASKSKLAEKDALELGRKLKSGRFAELKKRGLL